MRRNRNTYNDGDVVTVTAVNYPQFLNPDHNETVFPFILLLCVPLDGDLPCATRRKTFEILSQHSMTTHDTERSPLLARTKASKDGPLECHEISCTTRYGILAALWAGTFLCVSPVLFLLDPSGHH